MITCFSEFCDELIKAGFSMGGGNAKGIYAVVPFNWKSSIPGCPIQWHTGNPETDPWEWRMRVLEERDDIAYGKVFFGTSGYITKEWYPLFLAVRSQGMVFDEWYDEGKISQLEKNIYEAISKNGQKRNKFGEGYGWNSTVFCTVEEFWDEDLSTNISFEDAYQKIHDRILELNPEAEEKVIKKFIL